MGSTTRARAPILEVIKLSTLAMVLFLHFCAAHNLNRGNSAWDTSLRPAIKAIGLRPSYALARGQKSVEQYEGP